jgi:hypothetical protein
MKPSETYEKMLEELAAGEMTALQRKIFDLLRDYPQGYTRQELVCAIFGYMPTKIDGNTDDRKIRKAIERLRKRLFPIVSTSGKPGYRLDVSREAVRKMLLELESRKARLQEQIEAVSKFYEMPTTYRPDPAAVKQMELAI